MLSINMNDVITAIQSARLQIIFFCVILVLAVIAFITAAVLKKLRQSKKFLIRAEAGLCIVLALVITVNMICFGPMSTMISLATGSGTISDESMEEAYDYVNQIGEEGMVLLKNDGSLPLEKGTKLNVFG